MLPIFCRGRRRGLRCFRRVPWVWAQAFVVVAGDRGVIPVLRRGPENRVGGRCWRPSGFAPEFRRSRARRGIPPTPFRRSGEVIIWKAQQAHGLSLRWVQTVSEYPAEEHHDGDEPDPISARQAGAGISCQLRDRGPVRGVIRRTPGGHMILGLRHCTQTQQTKR